MFDSWNMGQLGLGHCMMRVVPQMVKQLQGYAVTNIAAGVMHSAAVTRVCTAWCGALCRVVVCVVCAVWCGVWCVCYLM